MISNILLYLSLLLSCPPPAAPVPSLETQTIQSITVKNENVFDLNDPHESKFPYRLANHLHRKTRKSTIRQQLLFRQGDSFDPQKLAESERSLRKNAYFSNAQIQSRGDDQGRVEVVVETRDSWTLTGGFSFGRSGGTNRSSFNLRDANLFGLGKTLALQKSFDVDRDSLLVEYEDPNFSGGRSRLGIELSDNSDGERFLIAWNLPFFALDSRKSVGFTALSNRRTVPVYRRGNLADQFAQESRHFEIYRGFSRGYARGRSHRWTFGLTFEEDRFTDLPEASQTDSTPFRGLVDRTLAYPWVDFERIGSTYLESRNMDYIGLTEDRYLGFRFHGRAGFSPRAFSGDRDRIILENEFSYSSEPTRESLFEISSSVAGRWTSDGFENVHWTAEAKYYRRVWNRHLFFARLSFSRDHRRDAENQLLLGGDNGLRGYPLRFQDGDRRFLLTLEQRFFTPWSLFRLADIGGAIFYDIGRAWKPGGPTDWGSGVLQDVGMGLRLGLNRSSSQSVVHIDIAIPLADSGGDLKKLQWLISTRKTF